MLQYSSIFTPFPHILQELPIMPINFLPVLQVSRGFFTCALKSSPLLSVSHIMTYIVFSSCFQLLKLPNPLKQINKILARVCRKGCFR